MDNGSAERSSKRSRRGRRRHGSRSRDSSSLKRPTSSPMPSTGPVLIPFRTCAQDIKFAILPDDRIKTLDGHCPKESDKLYIRHCVSSLTEYEVLSDVAYLHPQMKEWHLVVLGPSLPLVSHPVTHFTSTKEDWMKFWRKRHPNCQPEVIDDAD